MGLLPRPQGLWFLVFAPVVWALQFLAGYITAAIGCAKFANAGSDSARSLIATYVVLALLLIVVHGMRGLATYRGSMGAQVTTQDRRQAFIGFAGFLLALVSGIAVVYGALPLLILRGCA